MVNQKWHFYEVQSRNLKFFINIGFNKPLIGRESLDIMSGLLIREPFFKDSYADDRGFVKHYTRNGNSIDSDIINVRIEGGKHHVWCDDPWLNVTYDLWFEPTIIPWDKRLIRVGPGKKDVIEYNPRICSSKVTGTFRVNDDVIEVGKDALGYHDVDIGSPTALKWYPWVMFQTEDFMVIAQKAESNVVDDVPNEILGVYHDGKWITFDDVQINTFKDDDYELVTEHRDVDEFPLTIIVTAKSGRYLLVFRSEPTGDEFVINLGFGKYVNYTLNSMTHVTRGKLLFEKKVIHEFQDVPTRTWYSSFDLKKMIRKYIISKILPWR